MNKFYVFPPNPNDIYHYGIKRKSGRYPWGSGERPYQSAQSSGGLTGYLRDRKRKKQESAIAKEKENTEEQARAREQEKQEALRKGSASDILKFQGELTNDEMQKAVDRLRLEESLKSYASKEVSKAITLIDNAMKTVDTATNWAKIGTDTYNTFARIYNATEDGKKDPWTLIETGNQKKKKQE